MFRCALPIAPGESAPQTRTEDFSALFGKRRVHLVPPGVMRNPYRRRAIERDLQVLFEVESTHRGEASPRQRVAEECRFNPAYNPAARRSSSCPTSRTTEDS